MNNIRDKFEKQIAIMEANLIHDNDAYFEARPNVNTDGYKTIFNAGYKRAWQAATEQCQKDIAELKAREKELVEAISSSLNCIREEINLNNYTETALGDFISGYGDMVIILEQALATVRGE